MRTRRRLTSGMLVGVFLVAFFLRAYHPLSRPRQWLRRSLAFNQALDERDWASTYQQYHPGFTTMAISGVSLRLFEATSGTPAEALMTWAIPSYATETGRQTAAGVMGLALVIGGLLVAIALALHRLAGWPVALAAAGLLTFSPFYLAEGRVLHLDALVGSLMVLSAVLLLVSLESGRRRYLVLSGLAGGFAFLTKSPSLFLVPFTGLALLIYLVERWRAGQAAHAGERWRWLVGEAWHGLIGPLLLWVLAAILPFVLWPAMWVEPVEVLRRMVNAVGFQLGKEHFGRFFAGRIYDELRPPLYFYPVVMAFQSSFLTLTLCLAGVSQYALWRARGKLPVRPTIFWLLVAYTIFFTMEMTIGAHQVHRYILPASVAAEVLAAVGLVGVIELVRQAVAGRGGWMARVLPGGLVGLAVGLQALVALPYAPDYGAHYNHLLGGNRVAVRVVEITRQNEGVHYVGDYLSGRPNAASLQVGVSPFGSNSLKQYFPGEVNGELSVEDDYHLFVVESMQRDLFPDRWKPAWKQHEGMPPEVLVVIDGVEVMWLYATRSASPGEPIVIRRGGGVGFIVLAWVWTVALVATIVWALRRVGRPVASELSPGVRSGEHAGGN